MFLHTEMLEGIFHDNAILQIGKTNEIISEMGEGVQILVFENKVLKRSFQRKAGLSFENQSSQQGNLLDENPVMHGTTTPESTVIKQKLTILSLQITNLALPEGRAHDLTKEILADRLEEEVDLDEVVGEVVGEADLMVILEGPVIILDAHLIFVPNFQDPNKITVHIGLTHRYQFRIPMCFKLAWGMATHTHRLEGTHKGA